MEIRDCSDQFKDEALAAVFDVRGDSGRPTPAHPKRHSCKFEAEALSYIRRCRRRDSNPAHFGLKELARLSVWPELGCPARTEQKLISS